MRNVLFSLLFVSSSALAVPLEFQHQGRLFDGSGVALTANHDLTFSFYDTATGGSALWTETHTQVLFDEGYFAVQLGSIANLDADVFDGTMLYMEIAVDSASPLPDRIAVVSVPYAIRALNAGQADNATNAETAVNVSGGSVDATEILINGTTVIDGSGAISGSLPAHDHDAAQVATGVLDIQRIPVGTASTDVAAGDHLHTMSDITGGVVPIAMLPVGTDATDVAAGDHVHDAAHTTTGIFDVLRLPVGVSSGEVAAGDHAHDYGSLTGLPVIPAASDTCAAGIAGAIRWNDPVMEYCDGADWIAIGKDQPPGLTVGDPASSCQQIKFSDPALPSGVYWLETGTTPYQAYCEMDIDGGGWTLVASMADDGNNYWIGNNWAFLANGNETGDPADPGSDHQSRAWTELAGNEVMLNAFGDATKYAVYGSILSAETMASQYSTTGNTGPEYAADTISGSWWQQCGSGLHIRLETQDSDGNANFGKGIIGRSNNNNGCNYDDVYGGLQGDMANSDTTEAGWNVLYWYHQNFDNGALNVYVR